MFKFSLLSDLHLDMGHTAGIHTSQLEEWVIVAGDTSNGLGGLKTLEKLRRKGHKVFAVPGNHESYANSSKGRTIKETEQRFIDHGFPTHVAIRDDFHIIGANGWYNVSDEPFWQMCMNDSKWCAASARDVNEQAYNHANLIKGYLETLPGRFIVVTHTAPTMATLDPKYAGHPSNEFYWNPYMGEILREHADKIVVWNHGHTHAPADVNIFGVRVVCNPRGYPHENPNWKPVTIEIDS